MVIYNVEWTPFVNMLKVKCDCGKHFSWQTNITLIECIFCGNKEWWYGDGYIEEARKMNYKTAILNIKRKCLKK